MSGVKNTATQISISNADNRGFGDADIEDANGEHVAVCCHGGKDHYAHWHNADRIVLTWNSHDALVAENAKLTADLRTALIGAGELNIQVIELAVALDQCATRFERCCIHSGSDKEFAAHAVEDYRALVKTAKGES